MTSRRIALLLITLSMAAGPLAAQPPAPAAKPTAMPVERAKAMLADARVKAFLAAVGTPALAGSCQLPDPAKTMAQVTLPKIPADAPPQASGYASTKYEVEVTCSGGKATAAVLLGEFTPLTGDELVSLSLSLRFNR